MREHELRCPECGKLLGKTLRVGVVTYLRLWCRRCKMQVTPTLSREPEVRED